MLDRAAIRELIPHRPPFLLVDAVLAYEVGRSITALKHVAVDDPVFAGHFPDEPIYPGVLIAEALAQAVVVLLKLDPRNHERRFLFGGANELRFREPVRPGAELVLEAELTRVTASAAVASVRARVGDRTVAKGELITGSAPLKERRA